MCTCFTLSTAKAEQLFRRSCFVDWNPAIASLANCFRFTIVIIQLSLQPASVSLPTDKHRGVLISLLYTTEQGALACLGLTPAKWQSLSCMVPNRLMALCPCSQVWAFWNQCWSWRLYGVCGSQCHWRNGRERRWACQWWRDRPRDRLGESAKPQVLRYPLPAGGDAAEPEHAGISAHCQQQRRWNDLVRCCLGDLVAEGVHWTSLKSMGKGS